jgi:hypothetical protein
MLFPYQTSGNEYIYLYTIHFELFFVSILLFCDNNFLGVNFGVVSLTRLINVRWKNEISCDRLKKMEKIGADNLFVVCSRAQWDFEVSVFSKAISDS